MHGLPTILAQHTHRPQPAWAHTAWRMMLRHTAVWKSYLAGTTRRWRLAHSLACGYGASYGPDQPWARAGEGGRVQAATPCAHCMGLHHGHSAFSGAPELKPVAHGVCVQRHGVHAQLADLLRTHLPPTVGLEPTTTRLRALRSAG